MSHHTGPDYFAFTPYALVLLCGLAVAIFVSRQNKFTSSSYLVRRETKMMLFRRPLALRRSSVAIGTFLALMVFIVVAMSRQNLLVFFFNLVTGCCFLALIVYMTGPEDIRLDGDQRTYERTTGWPWKPATHIGPLEDIKGVYVSLNGQAMLLMNKRTFPYKGVVISNSGTQAAGQVLAEDVSREFGFPIVPYPK